MKISWKIALWMPLLASCAAMRPSTLQNCSREAALAHGVKEGASSHKADLSFLPSCSPESRGAALAAYREGFKSGRSSRIREKREPSAQETAEEGEEQSSGEAEAPLDAATMAGLLLPGSLKEVAAVSWVCEVEAESKVFTGVGVTRDEALGSARATCGSHIQASNCTKADCKQNL